MTLSCIPALKTISIVFCSIPGYSQTLVLSSRFSRSPVASHHSSTSCSVGIRLGPATPQNRPEASSFRSCAKDSSPTQPLPVSGAVHLFIVDYHRHAVSAQMHVQLNPVAAYFPRLLKGEHGVLRISGAKSPVGKIFGHLRPLLSDFHHIIKPRRCKGTGSGHPLASKREAGYNKYRFPLIRMDSPKNRKVVFSC